MNIKPAAQAAPGMWWFHHKCRLLLLLPSFVCVDFLLLKASETNPFLQNEDFYDLFTSLSFQEILSAKRTMCP